METLNLLHPKYLDQNEKKIFLDCISLQIYIYINFIIFPVVWLNGVFRTIASIFWHIPKIV